MRQILPCKGLVPVLVTAQAFLISLPPTLAHGAAPNGDTFSLTWEAPGRLGLSGWSKVQRQALERNPLTPEQWRTVLPFYVEAESVLQAVDIPPMAGRYQLQDSSVVFTPAFPLAPGTRYRATFHPDRLPADFPPPRPDSMTRTWKTPPPPAHPPARVTAVYPSLPVLPENLLKFYLHFNAPMSRGRVYQHIHLLDSNGQPVELPFLELDEELWNREMTRLTLFIDPGRIKRDVRPLEEIGPSLTAGGRFTLVIDSAWLDAQGNPMQEPFRREFEVSPPDRKPPDPQEWLMQSPPAGTREKLVLDFPEPLDHALALRLIHLRDSRNKPVNGNSALEREERRWTFAPDQAWQAGTYTLVVATTLEDLAGNNVGKPFEVDLFEGIGKRLTVDSVSRPVAIH